MLVYVIESGLRDLEKKKKEISKEEKEIEKPDVIVEIAEEMLKFNKQNQEGKGIKQGRGKQGGKEGHAPPNKIFNDTFFCKL